MEHRLAVTPRLIVSGGQSGVDRAALDVAIALGIDYAGWCPAGGLAEDRPEPPGLLSAYPRLREAPSADPAVRTEWNVRDTDATLVLGDVSRSPGTQLTVGLARALGRPLAVLPADAVDAVRAWLGEVAPAALDVAGPRASEQPGVYAEAYATLWAALASDGAGAGSTAP